MSAAIGDGPEARIEAIVARAEHAIGEDGSRPTMMLGGGMILAGCVLMIAGVAFAFSLTLMVWGAILTGLSLLFRARSHRARLRALAIAARAQRDLALLEARRETARTLAERGALSISALSPK